jgi:hypothetical protein
VGGAGFEPATPGFERGEVSGLTDEMLAELAANQWLVDPAGMIAIESKASVKSALGHRPDLAEALMLEIGEGEPVPFSYTPVALPTSRPLNYGHQGSSFKPRTCHHGRAGVGECGQRTSERDRVSAVARTGRGRWLLFPAGSAW